MEWYKYDIRQMDGAAFARWYGMMEEHKRCRVDRFRCEADKKRTVAADMLVRRAISARWGVPPDQIRFALGKHGKPYAVDIPLHFSVSHAGDMAVCALDERPVGIDIERIRPTDLRPARRIGTPEELCRLFGRPPQSGDFAVTDDPVLLTRFFELWTAREAAGKLTGGGLLSRPSFPVDLRYIREIPGYILCIATVK